MTSAMSTLRSNQSELTALTTHIIRNYSQIFVLANANKTDFSQCRKCRTPVTTIAIFAASATASDSASRCEPPG
jgi:hypothetical protein